MELVAWIWCLVLFNYYGVTVGLIGYCLLLKIKSWKYCSKIIFKCANNTVGLIFIKILLKKRFVDYVNSVRIHWQTHSSARRKRWYKTLHPKVFCIKDDSWRQVNQIRHFLLKMDSKRLVLWINMIELKAHGDF